MEAGAKRCPLYSGIYERTGLYELNVICKEEDIEKLEDIIFRETTASASAGREWSAAC